MVNVTIRLSELSKVHYLVASHVERGAFSSDTTRETGEMASL